VRDADGEPMSRTPSRRSAGARLTPAVGKPRCSSIARTPLPAFTYANTLKPASTPHAGEHVEVERPLQQLCPIHSRRPLLHPLLAGRCLTPRSRLLRLGELGAEPEHRLRVFVETIFRKHFDRGCAILGAQGRSGERGSDQQRCRWHLLVPCSTSGCPMGVRGTHFRSAAGLLNKGVPHSLLRAASRTRHDPRRK
jgi:hypothetical protein